MGNNRIQTFLIRKSFHTITKNEPYFQNLNLTFENVRSLKRSICDSSSQLAASVFESKFFQNVYTEARFSVLKHSNNSRLLFKKRLNQTSPQPWRLQSKLYRLEASACAKSRHLQILCFESDWHWNGCDIYYGSNTILFGQLCLSVMIPYSPSLLAYSKKGNIAQFRFVTLWVWKFCLQLLVTGSRLLW